LKVCNTACQRETFENQGALIAAISEYLTPKNGAAKILTQES
jgi:hypothetical protein